MFVCRPGALEAGGGTSDEMAGVNTLIEHLYRCMKQI